MARRQSQLISELQEKNRRLTQENRNLKESVSYLQDAYKKYHATVEKVKAATDWYN